MMTSSTNIHNLLLILLIITTWLKDGLADSKEKWYEDQNGRFKWSFGCSFSKDILFEVTIDKIKKKEGTSCPNLCYEEKRCTHVVYTKGYCNLKVLKFVDASPKAAIYNNPGGLCSFVFDRPDAIKSWVEGNNGKTRWATDCSYPNSMLPNQVATKLMFDKSKCSDHCLSMKRCTHFEWILNFCFLKDFSATPVVQTLDKTVNHVCGYIPGRKNSVKRLTKIKVSAAQPKTETKNANNMKDKSLPLLFNDDFSIDLNLNQNWNKVVGVTSVGFQYFTDNKENSYVENGTLFIKPTLTVDRYGNEFLKSGYLDLIKEGCDPRTAGKRCILSAKLLGDIINPVASASITTKRSFNFTFGTVEIRAKMPKGDWISTGIFLLPLNNIYGPWPLSGEIELLRFNSNQKMNCSKITFGRQTASSAIHFGPCTESDYFSFVTTANLNDQQSSPDFSDDFHIFRMDWTSNGFKFFIDGKMTDDQLKVPIEGLWKLIMSKGKGKDVADIPWKTESKMAPFDQPFFLSLAVSVGGNNYFPDSCEYGRPTGKPWSSSDSKPMQKFWNDIEHWLPTWKPSENKNSLQIDYIRVYGQ